jgi:hypothetical protein
MMVLKQDLCVIQSLALAKTNKKSLKKVTKRLGFERKNAYLYISRKGKAQDAF